jgi:hypothetical protein
MEHGEVDSVFALPATAQMGRMILVRVRGRNLVAPTGRGRQKDQGED